MDIDALIGKHILQAPDPASWVPAKSISRQGWQDRVESLIDEIRTSIGCPSFQISAVDITVHYHQPLIRFTELVNRKINAVRSLPGDDTTSANPDGSTP
ncbi:hypothetical protein [Nitratireductor sp. XY-223]|uniref:hypothetical protein n=1 Tax=Nitratireductor sp. XY-223 TaxID=2561926 RepID=UPI0010A9C8E7|nr:hypothetical protein [Nitratireductor sp. XY-223]